jgi:hypothetical protein
VTRCQTFLCFCKNSLKSKICKFLMLWLSLFQNIMNERGGVSWVKKKSWVKSFEQSFGGEFFFWLKYLGQNLQRLGWVFFVLNFLAKIFGPKLTRVGLGLYYFNFCCQNIWPKIYNGWVFFILNFLDEIFGPKLTTVELGLIYYFKIFGQNIRPKTYKGWVGSLLF